LAATAGHFDMVKYLVENGADINCKDRWGSTPLNDATDPTIIEYLTSKGAISGVQLQHNELPQTNINDS
jgi:ankyrin repeat protein